MCGIAGIVHTEGRPVDPGALRRMSDSLVRRGPDGRGAWIDGPVGFAHRRLAVIDLDGGRQPMLSPESGCALTYNGEIYNYREVRRQLSSDGCTFREQSDTEVLLRAYERWGEGCVDHLHGMFAFAMWDPRTRQLIAARDRLGIKPLYYRWAAGTLTFGSDITAILAADPACSRELDSRSFERYLCRQYVPAPETMVAGVRQLMPGCLLRVAFDRATIEERRYWAPRASNANATTLDGYAAARAAAAPDRHAAVRDRHTGSPAALHEQLASAVTSHLVADVPVGALLSGGIDSSLVVAHMMKSAGSSVHTFAVGFDDDRLDERAAAACVARHLGTIHHEQVVTAHDAAEALPTVVASMDQPLADYAAVPTYLIARFAAQHVKVVLTGEGADELFGGYRRYRRDWLLSPVQRWRAPYQPSHVFSARETAAITGRSAARVQRTPADRSPHGANGAPESASAARTPKSGAMDRVNQLLVRDVEGWLSDDLLVKVDRMTMACSLEARVPYLDHRFVEYALSIPGRRKIGMLNGATKMILRQAALPLVPPEIAARRKHGFKPPIDSWLRGPLRTLARDALLSSDARLRQRVDPASVHRLFDALDKGRPAGHRLWTLLVHELWSRDHGVA